MVKYWIAVASEQHVMGGVKGGFAQVCHGKAEPLKRMNEEDWLIYYSPTIKFQEKEPCRKFTAIGRVTSRPAYPFAINQDFIPWRRDIAYLPSHSIEIKPLIEQLSFIKDKKKWGFPFRRGCFSIPHSDFALIATSMGINER